MPCFRPTTATQVDYSLMMRRTEEENKTLDLNIIKNQENKETIKYPYSQAPFKSLGVLECTPIVM